MLFAAHAILGCYVHHACGLGVASHGGVAAQGEHHCASDHGTSHDPAENGEQPVVPCHHDSCSFVKVQPVRVDDGSGQILWVAAEMPAVGAGADAGSPTISNAAQPPAAFSVQLYVRFCALLI
jgi:hypothetical protein